MNAKLTLTGVIFALTVFTQSVLADGYLARSAPAPYGQAHVAPYGRPYFRSGRSTGTVSSAYVHGLADYKRAAGEYNYNTAAARSVNEQAYSHHLDNSVKGVETYIQMRDLNRQYLARKTRPLSPEAAQAISRARLPERLDAQQLNPTVGEIHWPTGLDTDDMANEREALESLFAERAFESGGLGSDNFAQVREHTQAMRSTLRSKIRCMDSSEYLAAKKFIDGLAYEARFSAVRSGNVAGFPSQRTVAQR